LSTLLLTRPNHDLYTNYLHYWNKPIIELAEQRGISVVDLPIEKATRKQLAGRVKKLNPEFIVINGHGKADTVAGHEDEPLVDPTNAEMLSGTITYSVSCSTAAELGPLCVRKGARAFIGFNRDVVIVHDLTKSTTPTQDNVAAQFIEPINAVSTSLLKGHTVKESHQNSQLAHRRNIKKLLSSAADKESAQYLRFLVWNMKSQVYAGDGSAKM
jgi:hypothetical protein